MNIYSECIVPLISLQEIDEKILKLEKEIALQPVTIAQINEEFNQVKEKFEHAKDEIKHIYSQKKEIENQILEIEESIKKNQKELNEVKSNDAFKALLNQIENLKKSKDDLETKELEILEELDKVSVKEKKLQDEYKGKEEEKNKKIKEIEDKTEILKKELENFKQKRQELVVNVEEELLAKYDSIRVRKNGIALVKVKVDGKNYFCGGCNMKLTPDQSVNVHKKNNLVLCENCGRMMYLKEDMISNKQ